MSDVPSADAPPDLRRRTAALHRLAAELASAANPQAIAFLVSTTAARLLEADACGVFSRTDAGALTTLHSSGWPAATAGQFTRVELRRGRPLSDAVLDGTPVWLEDAAQWRCRYPEMAPVGTSSGFQATACLPLRVQDRDLGAVVFSFLTPRAVPRGRARVPAGGRRPVRPGARPRPAPGRRAGRARRRRAPARPDDVPRPRGPADGGAPVGRGAPAAARGPRRPGHRRLVRGAPRARGPGRRGGGRPRDPAKVAFVARLQERYPPDPNAPGGAIEVSRTGRPAFFPEIPDALLVDGGGGRGAPAAHPVDRAALGGGGAAARARPQPGRVDAGARRVRAAVRRGRPRLHRSSWRVSRPSPWTTPGSTRSSVGSRRRCRTRCSRPCSRTCPGCAWPPATGRRPTTGPGCTWAATSTTSSRATRRAPGAWSWPTCAARAPRPRRGRR